MITRENGELHIICDRCETEIKHGISYEALEHWARGAGWDFEQVGNDMVNHCPACEAARHQRIARQVR